MDSIVNLLVNWIAQPIVAASIVALVGFLYRDLISRYIAGKVDQGFAREIELLRSDLRKSEREFEQRIAENASRASSARDVALRALSDRQSALNQRRLNAIDALWKAKTVYDGSRSASQILTNINYDNALEASARDPKVKLFFEVMLKTIPLAQLTKDKQVPSISSERPFLSPQVWLLYRAYTGIINNAFVRLYCGSLGLGDPKLLNEEPTNTAIKAALPHFSAYVDKFGTSGHYHLLDHIEEALVVATQKMLSGDDTDSQTLGQAQRIVMQQPEPDFTAERLEVPPELRVDQPVPPPDSV